MNGATPLLEIRGAGKTFSSGWLRKQYTEALAPISLSIAESPPSITAIAGESGSGKTTLARLMLGLETPTAGAVFYKGRDLTEMTGREHREYRREVQVILQDPFEAYNPFYKVDHVLRTPIKKYGLASSRSDVDYLVVQAIEAVGLRPDETLGRYPHQLSGGQRQRVMVARAMMLRPRIIVADEPVSMVDASMRATILESLRTLNSEFGISILYITHDLTTAYQLAENIIVLYRGRVAEAGDIESVINDPNHPYTRVLVQSIPQPDPGAQWGSEYGDLGAVDERPTQGCNFYDRCPIAMEKCETLDPHFVAPDEHRLVRCFAYDGSPEVDGSDLSATFVAAPAAGPSTGES